MASKITPYLMRSAVRAASRATRPHIQTRAISYTAPRRSDTLMVVRQQQSNLASRIDWRKHAG